MCSQWFQRHKSWILLHGPDTDRTRTKSAHVVGYELNSTTQTRPDPLGLCRRPARTQRSFAAKKVRAGPVGSVSGPCRVRVVEFSYKATQRSARRHTVRTAMWRVRPSAYPRHLWGGVPPKLTIATQTAANLCALNLFFQPRQWITNVSRETIF